jgi:predicted amidophosphoribosyltransferase
MSKTKQTCLKCERLNETIKPMSGEKLLCDDCLYFAEHHNKVMSETSIDTPQSNKVTLNDHEQKVSEAIDALKAINFVNNLGDENLLRQLLNVYVGRS